MALVQAVVYGVLEVDADDLGGAAVNSLAASENPEAAGFEAGYAFRQNRSDLSCSSGPVSGRPD